MQTNSIDSKTLAKLFSRPHTAKTTVLNDADREALLVRLVTAIAIPFSHYDDNNPETADARSQPLRGASPHIIHILNKISGTEKTSQCGEFIYMCDVLACYSIGYVRKLLTQITFDDNLSMQPGTPSHIGMERAGRRHLKACISECSLDMLAARRIAEAARAFGKTLDAWCSGGTTPDIDAIMYDTTLVHAAQLASRGAVEFDRAVQIYNLSSKEVDGWA